MRPILRLHFIVVAFMTLSHCGGGGGGEEAPLRQNACDIIGLTARIINGTACQGTSSIVKLTISGRTFQGTCSGTVISPTKVLTAAHCVLEDQYSSLIPPNGVTISQGDASRPLATSRSIHAPFFLSDLENIAQMLDPALPPDSPDLVPALLEEIIEEGLRDVAVVDLDRTLALPSLPIIVSSSPSSGDVISIFGFGVTTSGGDTPVNRVVSGQMRIDDVGIDNISAIFDTSGSDSCYGDSGGPAIVSTSTGPALVGITSLGFSDCQPGEVSVFAQTTGRIEQFLRTVAPDAELR